MSNASPKARLKRELRRLFRSMDFVSRHPALKKESPDAERFAESYQQLGMAWEFLALQCRHGDGFRQLRSGQRACKICGLIKDVDEFWWLLPRKGKKSIGRVAMPNSKKTFARKRAAQIVRDEIDFHGAKLIVDVHNSYRSRLFRSHNIAIAAERIVRLKENGVEYWVDTHLIRLRLKPREPKGGLPYSAFAGELPRKTLKNFPVLFEYDKRNRLVGLTIFKPDR